ncbi:hypothetical protein [Culicoidibacter larvae]|uniref:hypothetical protein n=1 Tax=Culicoidibacter larvae TaxID=2579976 RepID=UPI001485779C|nr:hypothetical protein [Culicoidibacter larvae]
MNELFYFDCGKKVTLHLRYPFGARRKLEIIKCALSNILYIETSDGRVIWGEPSE